jgi:hypothetical protein
VNQTKSRDSQAFSEQKGKEEGKGDRNQVDWGLDEKKSIK